MSIMDIHSQVMVETSRYITEIQKRVTHLYSTDSDDKEQLAHEEGR